MIGRDKLEIVQNVLTLNNPQPFDEILNSVSLAPTLDEYNETSVSFSCLMTKLEEIRRKSTIHVTRVISFGA